MTALVALDGVTVRYAPRQRIETTLLRDVTLSIGAGDKVCLIGTSERSGKSALLRVLAGILPPDAGRVDLVGESLYALPDGRRAALLRDRVGYVDPESLTATRSHRVVDLVAMGLMSGRISMRSAEIRARQALSRVRASSCADLSPAELTRAERIRVATARALVRDPSILLVDEPAALPDPDEVDSILRLLSRTARERGMALVVASNNAIALGRRRWDMIVHVSAGEITTSERIGEVLPFAPRRSA